MKLLAAVCVRSSAYTYDIFHRARPACMFLEHFQNILPHFLNFS